MPTQHTAVPAQRTAVGGTTAATSINRRRRGRGSVPAVPLGSLTQREHRHTEVCRGCGSPQVTKLSLSLTDGTPVDFTSCHRCRRSPAGTGELGSREELDSPCLTVPINQDDGKWVGTGYCSI